MSCSFLVTDARQFDCPIVYCSPTFEHLTGYHENEIVGRNCRFLQAPDGQVTCGSRRTYTDNQAVFHLKAQMLQNKEHQASIINYRKGGQVKRKCQREKERRVRELIDAYMFVIAICQFGYSYSHHGR